MAKKKNAKKIRMIELKKIRPLLLTKNFLWAAVILSLILAAFIFLKKSPYFAINNITVVDLARATSLTTGDLLRLYKGRNIFDVDIGSISSRIKGDYPVVKEVAVKRVMPGSLKITVVPRIPVAKVKMREYFPVDKTGMVLSPDMRSERVPVIVGVSSWLRPRVGERLKSLQLTSAFGLIDALKEGSFLSGYEVSVIDVSNYKNPSFYLESGIEVKVGSGNFADKLKKLKTTLANPDLDKDNIKYIDLRFEGVVIGPK